MVNQLTILLRGDSHHKHTRTHACNIHARSLLCTLSCLCHEGNTFCIDQTAQMPSRDICSYSCAKHTHPCTYIYIFMHTYIHSHTIMHTYTFSQVTLFAAYQIPLQEAMTVQLQHALLGIHPAVAHHGLQPQRPVTVLPAEQRTRTFKVRERCRFCGQRNAELREGRVRYGARKAFAGGILPSTVCVLGRVVDLGTPTEGESAGWRDCAISRAIMVLLLRACLKWLPSRRLRWLAEGGYPHQQPNRPASSQVHNQRIRLVRHHLHLGEILHGKRLQAAFLREEQTQRGPWPQP